MGMLVGIVAAVLLLVCLLFAGGGCSTRTSPGPPPPPIVSVAGMTSLDRAAVRAMLKRLADAPPPTKLAVGAMCYVVSPAPPRVDYICPKCGERTLYDSSKVTAEKLHDDMITALTVERELPWCRSEFQELRKVAGHAMELDESQVA